MMTTDLTFSDESAKCPRKEGGVPDEENASLVEAKPMTNISSGGGVLVEEENDDEDLELYALKGKERSPKKGGVSDEETATNFSKAQPLTDNSSREEVVDEEEDDMENIKLPDDVFSMLFVATWTSKAFWYALFVFAIQLCVLGLVAWDLLSDYPDEQDENKLNVPPIVKWQVMAAQSFAILIAVVNQDDITLSLILVSVGLSPSFRKALSSLQEKYPGGATQV